MLSENVYIMSAARPPRPVIQSHFSSYIGSNQVIASMRDPPHTHRKFKVLQKVVLVI